MALKSMELSSTSLSRALMLSSNASFWNQVTFPQLMAYASWRQGSKYLFFKGLRPREFYRTPPVSNLGATSFLPIHNTQCFVYHNHFSKLGIMG